MPALLRRTYRICTARQLAAIAASVGCPWDATHPGYADASLLAWRFIERFPVQHIHGHDDWEGWYSSERASAAQEPGQGYDFTELEQRLVVGDDIEPITLTEGPDRRFYLWDGCHRTAAARIMGVEFLPAIVGCRRPVVPEASTASPVLPAARLTANLREQAARRHADRLGFSLKSEALRRRRKPPLLGTTACRQHERDSRDARSDRS